MKKRKVTVYIPESSLRHPARMLRTCSTTLSPAASLPGNWPFGIFAPGTRPTALGLLGVYSAPGPHPHLDIFKQIGIVTVHDTALPYPVYVFTGTMIWAIFMVPSTPPCSRPSRPSRCWPRSIFRVKPW